MTNWFTSPDERRRIDQQRLASQRRFEQVRDQITGPTVERMQQADMLNPGASTNLKQIYALNPQMTPDQFEQLSLREAEADTQSDGGLGALIGSVGRGLGMGFYDQVVKPAIRGAFLVIDGAYKAVERPFVAGVTANRDPDMGFGEAMQGYGRTPLEQGIKNLTDGDASTRFDVGTGFFAGGQVGEQVDEGRTLEINGEQANLGRTVASAIFSDNYGRRGGDWAGPGDKAYDITAGVAQFVGEVVFDPTAWATMGATRAISASKGLATPARTLGQARRGIGVSQANRVAGDLAIPDVAQGVDRAQQLQAAGLIHNGQRSSVLVERTEKLFKNKKLLEEIASETSPARIMERMRLDRAPARGDELADLINDLARANSPELVADRLLTAVRTGHVAERGFFAGAGSFIPNPKEVYRQMRFDKNLPEFRYGGMKPNTMVSASNRMQSAKDVDALLKLAKVGKEDRAALVSRALSAQDNVEMLNIATDTVRVIGGRTDDVETLVKAHKSQMNRLTAYLVDEAGQANPAPWSQMETVTFHGIEQKITVPKASMLAHLNRSGIGLPDPTDIRRATTQLKSLRSVYESAGWDMATSAASFVNRNLFKFPTLFTRIAYPLRNNLDNQARAAGAGYASIFTNPVRWLHLGIANPNKFKDIVSNPKAADIGNTVFFGRRAGTVTAIDDVTGIATVNVAKMKNGVQTKLKLEEIPLAELNTSENFREIARQVGALTDTASGMWVSKQAKEQGAYITFGRNDKQFVHAWAEQLQMFANDDIATRVAAGAYKSRDELIDSVINDGLIDQLARMGPDARQQFFKGGTVADRRAVDEYLTWTEGNIELLTKNTPELRQMIATRKLGDLDVNNLQTQDRLVKALRDNYVDSSAPMHVSGSIGVGDPGMTKSGWKASMDYIVDFMASRPENFFTRYPLLAEVFSDDLARLMPTLADDALRLKLVERAAAAGFDNKMFPRIAQAAQRASGQKGVNTSIETVVEAAKLHSSDRMLDIAFDATQRSAFQDMADVAFPFWDAFTEVATSWGRILRDNPAAISRGGSTMMNFRDAGVFYANENGEEVFGYPGGGMLAKALGIKNGSVVLEGRVEGLNLITQGIGPGFGPMVQWAVGAFTPDTPELSWLRELVTPFGTDIESPSDLANVGKLANDLMPAWMQKAVNAWSEGDYDPQAWNSAVGDALKVLSTTGGYDPADPESQRRLVEDAEQAARWTMFLRSALQMGAPTGPGVQWEVQSDPDGEWHRINTMASIYYELEQSSDPHTATMAFIEMYGLEPFWITQGKTQQLRPGPRTRDGLNWIGRNREAAERHEDVIGHFVPPEDPLAPPDYALYQARLKSGDLESLTGEQQRALGNKNKARAMYSAIQKRTEGMPPSQRNRVLASARDQLELEFPGWSAEVIGVGSRIDRDERIRKLELAVADEALSDSPVTAPLSAYLTLRRRVLAEIEARGGAKTLGARENEAYRQFLFDRGSELVLQDAGFQGIWQAVLSSEVEQV